MFMANPIEIGENHRRPIRKLAIVKKTTNKISIIDNLLYFTANKTKTANVIKMITGPSRIPPLGPGVGTGGP